MHSFVDFQDELGVVEEVETVLLFQFEGVLLGQKVIVFHVEVGLSVGVDNLLDKIVGFNDILSDEQLDSALNPCFFYEIHSFVEIITVDKPIQQLVCRC